MKIKTLLKHLAIDTQEAGYLDDVQTAIIHNGQSASLKVKKEIGRIEKAIQTVNIEIENVFRLQSENPFSDSANALITERIEALSKKKSSSGLLGGAKGKTRRSFGNRRNHHSH